LGRFVGRDPIGYTEGLHLYAYVGNQPSSYVDPTGLFWGKVVEVIGGAVVGYLVTKVFDDRPPECSANQPRVEENQKQNCSLWCYPIAPAQRDPKCPPSTELGVLATGDQSRTVQKDCRAGKWKEVYQTAWTSCSAKCPSGYYP